MKIKVVIGKTVSDNVSVAWTDIQTIEIEIPDGYHVIGEQEVRNEGD